MGMYTELIFGASLKKGTPNEVIECLKYMMGEIEEKPNSLSDKFEWLFRCASYYFGVCRPVTKMWKDRMDNAWVISTRSNIKNYHGEIEAFLDWIKPHIGSGSGNNEMYAIVIYVDSEVPKMYYLYEY